MERNFSCKDCRFFKEIHSGAGICRRYPPQAWAFPDLETSNPLIFSFPEMSIDDWCGEFQPLDDYNEYR